MGKKEMTIAVGCDHAGYVHKDAIVEFLKNEGYQVVDHGTDSADSTDYADHIHPVGCNIDQHSADLGIILCGSGNGAAMTANKHRHVRAALCWNVELAKLARAHNDANVLAIPGRFVDRDTALAMVEAFLNTDFDGGRHARRVNKISSHPKLDC